ncbi:glycosyltransferase 61 family protein [Limimaricola pyoseonensis]|uniref:Glycosyltransferase 61 catalytic domain-containing protein n=1 Tax=Limimaricola pyoseonensis TaxID=521013 RepID=A0A1G6ZR04_9RHOB|nr:glycosyltransferase 61 family protein [Limimaricola pyoseonensis]SDE04803.1 Protein of unknown function [Limimaricola pyoseonensis]
MTTAAMAPPDLSAPLSGRIATVTGALVVPPPKGSGNRTVQRSGVLGPDGRYVAQSMTWRGERPITLPPAPPPEGEIETLPGRWLFLGPLFGHFGHFLVESLARIWAFDALRHDLDGVLYVPKAQVRPQHVARSFRPLLGALGLDAPMRNLEAPTRVERLHVPPQGLGMFDMIEGAPEFRRFIRRHAGADIPADGPERIYISRSALPAARGSILGESWLERRLAQEGYVAFHPQQHDHRTQIATYKAARRIVSVDGSPLHLLAMVGDAGQRVGIVARRPGGLDEVFARQIRAFSGASVTLCGPPRGNWVPDGAAGPNRLSWGEIDFPRAGAALAEGGLVDHGPSWTGPEPAELAAEIARVGAANGRAFHRFDAERPGR